MTLNATLLGQFILLLVIIVGVVAWRLAAGGWRLAAGGWRLAAGGWRLARRKSQHPVLITFLCVLLCLFPPFAILALLILALRRDLPAHKGCTGCRTSTGRRTKTKSPMMGLFVLVRGGYCVGAGVSPRPC